MSQILVQLRAGMLVKDGTTLKPDPRKGLIKVVMDGDGMIHFQWIERNAAGEAVGDLEVDLVTFPTEAEFQKIDRPGSRVFLLKFSLESDRNLFFWAQEPDAETDATFVQSVNAALGSVVDGMDQDTTTTTPASENPRAPSVTPATAPSPGNAIGANQLAAALGSIIAGASASGGGAQGGMNANSLAALRQQLMVGPPLGEVLKAERISPLLENPTLIERLAPYLPEEHRSPEAIREIINSPQFKHQLDILTQALATGQLDTSTFGLGAPAFGVGEFLKAIQREADKEKQEQEDEEQGGKSGDAMNE